MSNKWNSKRKNPEQIFVSNAANEIYRKVHKKNNKKNAILSIILPFFRCKSTVEYICFSTVCKEKKTARKNEKTKESSLYT